MISLAFVLAVLASPPLSGPAETIRSQAAECWDLPAGARESAAHVTLEVSIAEGGEVKAVTIVQPHPDKTALGRSVETSATPAIKLCAPYVDVPKGVFTVPMGWQTIPDEPINPLQ